MRRYITFKCIDDCVGCVYAITGCKYADCKWERLPYVDCNAILCAGTNCDKCPVRFECFTTKSNDEPLMVSSQMYKALRRKYKKYPLDTSYTFEENGLLWEVRAR